MRPLRFVVIDARLLDAVHESRAALESCIGASDEHGGEILVTMLEQTVALLAAKPRAPEWGCFLTVDDAVGQLVGGCGYKDGPAADGSVEVAYGTFPPFEGQGYATAMAVALVVRAGRRRVLAHTLPERNASGRVLEKAGFIWAGEFIDPEDGLVWRWVAGTEKGRTGKGTS
jgi:[ribosomal protein S5]-alanine N-acetyltransferase